jgi:MFS family permease
LVGNLFYLAKKSVFKDNLKNESGFFVKYTITFSIGMIVGTFFYLFFNDIFSNSQMNDWGWKSFYFFLILLNLIFGYFFNLCYVFDEVKSENNESSLLMKETNFLFIKNFSFIFPFYFFLIYSCSEWLPKFSNPNNMQFLDYNMLYIFLTIILTIFTYPLFKLIGNKRSKSFILLSITVISFVAFFFDYSSSYSINFLKFYISLVSSFVISLNLLNNNQKVLSNSKLYLDSISLYFLVLSVITPISFYYFINFSISYDIVYVIIGLIFLVSFLSGRYSGK